MSKEIKNNNRIPHFTDKPSFSSTHHLHTFFQVLKYSRENECRLNYRHDNLRYAILALPLPANPL